MALSAFQPWHYFDAADQAAAVAALRAAMGSSYASSPDAADLLTALSRAVSHLHKRTQRFFLQRTGSLVVDGNGAPLLPLPHPVISTDQGGTGITAITVNGETIDSDSYVVNEGAQLGDDDPRDNPFVTYDRSFALSAQSLPPIEEVGYTGWWTPGTRNVVVTGSFGYVEEDGSTPSPILDALARLCIRQLVPRDDEDALEDLRRGALIYEQTQGRSYSLATGMVSGGSTGDRELDQVIAEYTRPPTVHISRPARRRRRYL